VQPVHTEHRQWFSKTFYMHFAGLCRTTYVYHGLDRPLIGCAAIGNFYKKISRNCNVIVFEDNVVPCQTESGSRQ